MHGSGVRGAASGLLVVAWVGTSVVTAPPGGELRHPAFDAATTFASSGASVALEGGGRVAIGLGAFGRDGAMHDVEDAAPEIVGAEVHVRRATGVVEWWRALPSGLEQGVTFTARPEGDGTLVLDMDVGPGIRAVGGADGEVLLADGASGRPVARYDHLAVLDADGARVSADLAAHGDHIRIRVDDWSARYPLVVDLLLALLEEAVLSPPGATNSVGFGQSVAISADGVTAIVGAPVTSSGGRTLAGAAHVLVRSGTTWTAQAVLVPADSAPNDRFGESIDLSADGSVALIGAARDDSDGGSARIFRRTGTVWSEEATLRAVDTIGDDLLGTSLALTPDGTRAVVGAPGDDQPFANSGSALVFVATGTTWAQEATLAPALSAADDRAGTSVAINADGTRVVLGAPQADEPGRAGAGRVVVFHRVGTVWSEEQSLVAAMTAGEGIGASVDITPAGDLVLAGAPGAVGGLGQGYGFTRTGATWALSMTFTAATAGGTLHAMGRSAAVSADGTRAFFGAPAAAVGTGPAGGALFFYVRTGTVWDGTTNFVTSATSANLDRFGTSVALSTDGTRLIACAPSGGADPGTAHIFTIAPAGPVGAACGGGAECLGGQCVDGFCCDRGCGFDSRTDCFGCAARLTGNADGTCGFVLASAAEVCRPSLGGCDPAETCNGTANSCPADAIASAGATCRAAAGPCDVAEVCSGSATACPGDGFASGVVCRSPVGDCDVEERCSGTTGSCPSDSLVASGVVCRGSTGACDTPDACDGVTTGCLDVFAGPLTACGSVPSDVCDAPDHCSGSSADCVATFLDGTECRASAGGCDLAEVCSGAGAACPPNALVPAGVSCRASTDPICDPEETCDGLATACPTDTSTCVDAGGASDAAIGSPDATTDGGTPPSVAATGCACRADTRTPGGGPTALLVVLGSIAWLRRRARG